MRLVLLPILMREKLDEGGFSVARASLPVIRHNTHLPLLYALR
jgi:hypothetical protein